MAYQVGLTDFQACFLIGTYSFCPGISHSLHTGHPGQRFAMARLDVATGFRVLGAGCKLQELCQILRRNLTYRKDKMCSVQTGAIRPLQGRPSEPGLMQHSTM